MRVNCSGSWLNPWILIPWKKLKKVKIDKNIVTIDGRIIITTLNYLCTVLGSHTFLHSFYVGFKLVWKIQLFLLWIKIKDPQFILKPARSFLVVQFYSDHVKQLWDLQFNPQPRRHFRFFRRRRSGEFTSGNCVGDNWSMFPIQLVPCHTSGSYICD